MNLKIVTSMIDSKSSISEEKFAVGSCTSLPVLVASIKAVWDFLRACKVPASMNGISFKWMDKPIKRFYRNMLWLIEIVQLFFIILNLLEWFCILRQVVMCRMLKLPCEWEEIFEDIWYFIKYFGMNMNWKVESQKIAFSAKNSNSRFSFISTNSKISFISNACKLTF